jgi:rootletin
MAAELGPLVERLQLRRDEATAAREQIEAKQSTLDRRLIEIGRTELALQKRREELTQLEAELRAELEAREAELERQRVALDEELRSARQDLEHQRAELEEQLQAERHELECQRVALDQQLAAEQQELEHERAALDEQLRSARRVPPHPTPPPLPRVIPVPADHIRPRRDG